jgi:bifunctional N-acetylglutamate synthase/kinase
VEPATAQEVIAKLLTNIGSRSEVEQYLRHYASGEAPKLAIVKVSGRVLETSRDDIVSALAFLHRVGLRAILVIGARPQLRRALAAEGIESRTIAGLRVTPPAVLAVARRVFEEESLRLAEALEALGTRARPIHAGVFHAVPVDNRELGLVGRVVSVSAASIWSAVRTNQLPILSPLGETADGQIVRLDSDTVTGPLATAMTPHKVILINPAGGLVDRRGRLIPAINIREDFDAVLAELPDDDKRERLRDIARVLELLPSTTSVSITSADHVARELFTHRGAGTLIRLGEAIQTHADFASVDRERLRELVMQSFGRPLDPSYFVTRTPSAIYLAESYRGVAILTREDPDAVPYLDKFAVTPEAQGEGIGSSIWRRMRRDHPAVYWRARASNPINGWYAAQADGMYKSDAWTVFWIGIRDFATIAECVQRALALPATLGDAPTGPIAEPAASGGARP